MLLTLTSVFIFGVLFELPKAEARTGLGVAENYAECMEDWTRNTSSTKPSQVTAERACQIRFQSSLPLNADGSVKSDTSSQGCSISNPFQCIWQAFLTVPGTLAIGVLKIASLLTYLAGAILNFAVRYSVVDMKKHLDEISEINNAWRVIRDVANMAFIFVLLYAAIQTILGIGKDTQRLIVRIVAVAILINFSLFFTKFVIDVSNVLAMTFYDAIAPGSLSVNATTGLADSLMAPLNLQSIWNTAAADGHLGDKLLTIGVMGTIFTLISAFVLFAVAIMFIIRFVVLMLVLVLSPIAFIAFILPQAEKYRSQWVDALIAQAFFAPIYFMMTWIVIVISRGLFTGGSGTLATALTGTIDPATGAAQAPDIGSVAILMNFIIVIVMLIASLVVAKEWAGKTPGGVSKLTGWAMGAAGTATLGLAGKAGRKTLGSWGGNTMNDDELKARARQGDMAARLKLATASRMAKSSFDMRATGIGATLGAGKGQKGGFIQDQKDAAKKFESYKPSGDSIKAAKEEESRHEKGVKEAAEAAERKTEEHIDAENRLKELRRTSTRGMTDEQIKTRAARMTVMQEEIKSHEEELAKRRKVYAETSPDLEPVRKAQAESKERRQNLEGTMENMAKTSETRGRTLGILKWRIPGSGYIAGGKNRAAAIRAAAKGKSAGDKAKDLIKEIEKESGGEEEKPKESEGGGDEKKTT